ncbi:MAG: DUF4174 domain-containing protein [Pseudomonadota bacterium]
MLRVLFSFALLSLAGLPSTGAATDAAATEPTAVERWEADPTTIFEASEIDISDFQWLARPVIVFADAAANPAFEEQLALLQADIDGLVERDVVLITDTDPDGASGLRTKLRPRGFMLTLIGKDGGVKLRKPFPWDVRELSRTIDKMPMRQREIREGQ